MRLQEKARVEEALGGISQMLESDGYRMSLELEPDQLLVSIVAGPSACEECLVPKDLMSQMVVSELRHHGLDLGSAALTLSYPTEATH